MSIFLICLDDDIWRRFALLKYSFFLNFYIWWEFYAIDQHHLVYYDEAVETCCMFYIFFFQIKIWKVWCVFVFSPSQSCFQKSLSLLYSCQAFGKQVLQLCSATDSVFVHLSFQYCSNSFSWVGDMGVTDMGYAGDMYPTLFFCDFCHIVH